MKLKLKLIYDRQPVGQSVLVSGAHLGPVTNFFFILEISFRQLSVCYFVAPSLTRGRVCNLLYNCFWDYEIMDGSFNMHFCTLKCVVIIVIQTGEGRLSEISKLEVNRGYE
jgi:hypothetical protein